MGLIISTELKKAGDYFVAEATTVKGANVIAVVKRGEEEFVYFEEGGAKAPYKSKDIKITRIDNKFSLILDKPDRVEFLAEYKGKKESKVIDLEDRQTIEEVLDVMENVKNVFLMFNSNIDAIKHVGGLRCSKYEDRLPKKLENEKDLFAGLMYSMKRGEPLELAMNEKMEAWLMKNIKPDKMRMGGQAGIMSNFLSSLGVRSNVYTPLLSKEQCSMFKEGIFLLTKSGFKPASKAARKDPKKINWIFEYNKGDKLAGIEAIENNRFIAASRPEKFRLEEFIIDEIPDLAGKMDCFIVSGFQGIKEKYNDGVTRKKQFAIAQKILEKIWKCDEPMHLELTSIKDESLRALVLGLGKYMDSIGLDEAELADALESFGEKKLAKDLRKNYDVIKLYEGTKRLLKKTKAKKIHLHNEGCFIAVCHKDYHVTPKEIKKSMVFATVTAAAAAMDEVYSKNDIWRGLTVEKTETGIEKEKVLKKYLKCKGIEMEDGIAVCGDETVVFVPNRIAHRVRDVVGLGDVISSSIFVAENGYRIGDR